jgi:thiamine biosynthesis lipoprotein
MPAIVLLLASLTVPVKGVTVSETRPAFASLATVTLSGVAEARARAAIEAAFEAFARVEWSMNEWRPGTPLADLNAAAGRSWTALPPDLCAALALAKEAAERTQGRFDPTWAAVSELWRFDGTGSGAPPSDAALSAACPLVGHRGLELRGRGDGGCEGRLERPGMKVGLGGLAKGWALDAAAATLRRMGVESFLLQAGGDLYAAGTRDGAPWRVQVRDPRGGPADALPHVEVEVRDRAFSTTGDYEHAYVSRGRRFHHVIDPRTCRPAEASRAVTVLARSAVEAEVLGKSLFVLGGAPALAEAARHGARAIVIDRDGEVLASPGLLPAR